MPLKVVQLAQCTLLMEAGTAGLAKIQNNTSIAESSDQSVEWYREMITQLMAN
jgi:hypothetical protein